jgi:hypothetical protein
MTRLAPASVARPVDSSPSETPGVLANLEACATEAAELLGRAKLMLSSFGEKILSEEYAQQCAQPGSLASLLELLSSVGDPIDELSRVQTIAGAEAMLTLAMGHGVPADFEKITGEFPRDAQGNEVDLTIFLRDAERLARRVFELVTARSRG